MADISVERKGPGVWPWIIGLVVLALLIWVLVEIFGNASPTDRAPAETPAAAPAPGSP